MSDCGGDCGGDTGGDYGGDCGGDYGGDCGGDSGGDCGGDSGRDCEDEVVDIITFESDYGVETTYSPPDSPVESTHITYFESSAPAYEEICNNENDGESVIVVEEHVTHTRCYENNTNNWNNQNDYRPRQTWYNNHFVTSSSSEDCNCKACFKPSLIFVVACVILIIVILIFKLD